MAASPDARDRRRGGDPSSYNDSAKASFSTVSRKVRPPRPTKTFGGRMVFYFVMTAVMTAAVLSMVLAITWEGQFQVYTRQNMEQVAKLTADSLAKSYDAEGYWSSSTIDPLRNAEGATSEIAMQVTDSQGAVLYDTADAGGGQGQGASGAAIQVLPGVTGEDSAVSEDIVSRGGAVVGTVRIWAAGSNALLTKNDAAFKASSYEAILLAAAIAVGVSLIIAYIFSRSLAQPIRKITDTAARIRNGDLTARTHLTGDDEFGRLGETFDGMAGEIERDIKFEHRLTSDVAHELRTPLMATQATVEAMQDGVLPADDEHFETVAAEVRRLSRLVDAMLHLSRIENGTSELKVEDTDLVYMVRSLVSVQEALFREKDLRLRFDDTTPQHELHAEVNPDLIREAVTNLLSNAMRYTPEGGWVLVTIGRDHDDALISVQDTGMGIAKEDVSRVFSRFWRSDASRERVSGGLGVGLSLTKEIVDRHNGSISVESELGKGTTFSLRIPLTHTRQEETVIEV